MDNLKITHKENIQIRWWHPCKFVSSFFHNKWSFVSFSTWQKTKASYLAFHCPRVSTTRVTRVRSHGNGGTTVSIMDSRFHSLPEAHPTTSFHRQNQPHARERSSPSSSCCGGSNAAAAFKRQRPVQPGPDPPSKPCRWAASRRQSHDSCRQCHRLQPPTVSLWIRFTAPEGDFFLSPIFEHPFG